MFDELLRDLTELPDSALDGHIRQLELQRRRLDAELATAVAVAEHRQLGALDGHRTINAYLRATLNCSNVEASRLRSLGRAVDQVDGLADAWLDGHIGESQAARFGVLVSNRRVNGRLGEFAPMLLDHAEQLPYADFSTCVEQFVSQADEDGAHDARDDAVEHRDAHVRHVGGMSDITAHGGDGITTSELIAIHRRFVEAEFRADVEARRAEFGDDADTQPLPRTAGQRRFDALASIFRHAAEAEGLGTSSDPLVNVVVDSGTWAKVLAESGLAPSQTLGGAQVDPFTGLARTSELLADLVSAPDRLTEVRCETNNGVPLHPHDVLRAALAGHVRRVVVDAAGVVTDMGRRRRLYVGAAREAALLLLTTCEHPGCELPAEACNVDHAVEWVDGGATDQANSSVRCGRHNTDKHRQQWRSKRAANGRTYTVRADGTIMLPVGVRPPTFPDEDDVGDSHTPAEIEHLTRVIQARVRALVAA